VGESAFSQRQKVAGAWAGGTRNLDETECENRVEEAAHGGGPGQTDSFVAVPPR
jgi:hypothetical protein